MSTDREPREEALRTLRRMVEIPSVTGAVDELARYLAGRMAELGYRAHRDRAGNVVGEAGGPGGPAVMLLGHIDTVPGLIPVRSEGGRLHGRGAVDAKGPFAAMLHAGARAAADHGTRVVAVGAVDEEGASRGARHLLAGARPDALVIGEPSGGGAVVIGYKGLLNMEYRVRRPPSHTSGPEEKAVEVAVDGWHAVRRLLGERYPDGPLFGRAIAALTRLTGDLETATATIACRIPPGFDAAPFLDWFRALAPGTTVTVTEHVPAVRTRRTDPVATALSREIRRRGRTPVTKVKLGTSDMNVVAPHWAAPMAAYGPGDARLDHGPEEYIEFEEFLFAVDVLAGALPEIAAAVGTGPGRQEEAG